MTQLNAEFAELQELKKLCELISQKLEKQEIINENVMAATLKQGVSGIRRTYRFGFLIQLIALPIIIFVFLMLHLHWGYITLVIAIGLMEFLFSIKGYRMLEPDKLVSFSMSEASERALCHKHLCMLRFRILLLPEIAMMIWTILIACNYQWNVPIIAGTVLLMIVSITVCTMRDRRNWKKLDDALRQVREMK